MSVVKAKKGSDPVSSYVIEAVVTACLGRKEQGSSRARYTVAGIAVHVLFGLLALPRVGELTPSQQQTSDTAELL